MSQKRKSSSPTRIDLHARKTDEARSLTEQFISDAIMAEHERIEIIHGLGTGKVKDTVHRLLSSLDVVKNYKIDPQNPGVTIVWL